MRLQSLSFAFKAPCARCRAQTFPLDFQCHIADKARVRGAVHFSHSTRADLFQDVVMPDALVNHAALLRAMLRRAVPRVNAQSFSDQGKAHLLRRAKRRPF